MCQQHRFYREYAPVWGFAWNLKPFSWAVKKNTAIILICHSFLKLYVQAMFGLWGLRAEYFQVSAFFCFLKTLFKGKNFAVWKVCFRIFLRMIPKNMPSISSDRWSKTKNGYQNRIYPSLLLDCNILPFLKRFKSQIGKVVKFALKLRII